MGSGWAGLGDIIGGKNGGLESKNRDLGGLKRRFWENFGGEKGNFWGREKEGLEEKGILGKKGNFGEKNMDLGRKEGDLREKKGAGRENGDLGRGTGILIRKGMGIWGKKENLGLNKRIWGKKS